MVGIILVVAALIVLVKVASWLVHAFPRFFYGLYEFSGILCILSSIYAITHMQDYDEVAGLVASSIICGGLFFMLWLAKFTGNVCRSTNNRWWMLLLKANCIMAGLVCFPIGILSLLLHRWFVVERIQDR